MLKLMKYEFKKQALTKGIMLALVAVIEVVFLIGVVVKTNEALFSIPLAIIMLVAFAAVLFVSIESVFTFSNDLKTKSSYMLFMTPYSSFTIIGAKLFVSFITLFLTGLAFLFLITGNFTLMAMRIGGVAEVRDMIALYLNEFWNIHISFYDVLRGVVWVLINFAVFITTAFVSMAISATVLANKRMKGLVSLIIFIILNLVFTGIANRIIHGDIWTSGYFWLSCGLNLIYLVATYYGTGWLLDRKISL